MEYPRFDLTGQVSLVTGAARGLGRAIALALAHAGSDVALGLRDANTARDLADEVQSMRQRFTTHGLNFVRQRLSGRSSIHGS